MDKDPFSRYVFKDLFSRSVVKKDPCLYLVKYSPVKKKTKVLKIYLKDNEIPLLGMLSFF